MAKSKIDGKKVMHYALLAAIIALVFNYLGIKLHTPWTNFVWLFVTVWVGDWLVHKILKIK